jgi:hypothetical protein
MVGNLIPLNFLAPFNKNFIVGMITLNPEMNKALKHPTQPVSDEDDTPLVQLDVFHQLHCLNAIWNVIYGTNP